MWPDCIQYLKVTAIFTKNIFQKEEDSELVKIVKQCYDRGQLLDLDDYGYVILFLFFFCFFDFSLLSLSCLLKKGVFTNVTLFLIC